MKPESVTSITIPRDWIREATPDQLRLMADQALRLTPILVTSDQTFTVLRFLDIVHDQQRRRSGVCL